MFFWGRVCNVVIHLRAGCVGNMDQNSLLNFFISVEIKEWGNTSETRSAENVTVALH